MKLTGLATKINLGYGPLLEPAVTPPSQEKANADEYVAGLVAPEAPLIPHKPNYLGYLGALAGGAAGFALGSGGLEMSQKLDIISVGCRTFSFVFMGCALGASIDQALGQESRAATKTGAMLGMAAGTTLMVLSMTGKAPLGLSGPLGAALVAGATLGVGKVMGDIAQSEVDKHFERRLEGFNPVLEEYQQKLEVFEEKRRVYLDDRRLEQIDVAAAPDEVSVNDVSVSRN